MWPSPHPAAALTPRPGRIMGAMAPTSILYLNKMIPKVFTLEVDKKGKRKRKKKIKYMLLLIFFT